MALPTQRADCHCVLFPLVAVALILFLPTQAQSSSSDRLNRGGYLSTTLTPLLQESNLQGTSYMPILDEMFAARIADFNIALAEGLEKTTFSNRIVPAPGYRPERHIALRQSGQQDTFLVSIDLRTDFGLTESSPLAAMASGASCFLLSTVDMFRYRARSDVYVNVHYFPSEGKPLRILNKSYKIQESARGDFLQTMSMAREVEWISQLTVSTLEQLKRAILADLPREIPQRAWRKAATDWHAPPRNVPSADFAASRLGPNRPETSVAISEKTARPLPEAAPKGQGLTLTQIARRVSPSICKVEAQGRTGSGFVLSEKGYILTSLSVVEGAEQITVRFHGGQDTPARPFLAEKDLDLAVLALKGGPFPPLELDDGAPPAPKTRVISFGFTTETGLHITETEVTETERRLGRPLFRIAAALSEGNRGAPLVDASGRCVGVTIRTSPESAQGVPASEIRRVFNLVLDPDDRQKSTKKAAP